MKYLDIPAFFYTDEQMSLPQEAKDELLFADMQLRTARFYAPPKAIIPAMENGAVCASIWYLGSEKFFIDVLPLALHEKIEQVWPTAQ